MSEPQNIIISSGDYFALQSLIVPPGEERDLLVELIRRKLHQAIVAFPSDIGPDVVGIGSRVQYRINGLRTEERSLLREHQQPDPGVLTLLSVHGLALLGLSVGQSAVVRAGAPAPELLAVEAVSRSAVVRTATAGAGRAAVAPPRETMRVLRFQPRPAVTPAPWHSPATTTTRARAPPEAR